LVYPGVQIKSIEGDALRAERNLGQLWAYLGVEPVAVHAEVEGRIAKANEPRRKPVFAVGRHQ
jgi:hypothetical protein